LRRLLPDRLCGRHDERKLQGFGAGQSEQGITAAGGAASLGHEPGSVLQKRIDEEALLDRAHGPKILQIHVIAGAARHLICRIDLTVEKECVRRSSIYRRERDAGQVEDTRP